MNLTDDQIREAAWDWMRENNPHLSSEVDSDCGIDHGEDFEVTVVQVWVAIPNHELEEIARELQDPLD
jgi:hypothetical protein